MKARGDRLDISQLEELATYSPAYQRIRDRIEETIFRWTKDLKTASTWEDCIRLQACISTLEMVQSLPKILTDEMRAGNR